MAVSKLLSNTFFFFNLKGPSPDRKRLSGRYDPSSKVYVILQKKYVKAESGNSNGNEWLTLQKTQKELHPL